MKVVIDTHGILSAVSSHSPNKWLYDAFMDEQFIWVASNEIISEYSEIIGQNFGIINQFRKLSEIRAKL